jgi:hypothetical protein
LKSWWGLGKCGGQEEEGWDGEEDEVSHCGVIVGKEFAFEVRSNGIWAEK